MEGKGDGLFSRIALPFRSCPGEGNVAEHALCAARPALESRPFDRCALEAMRLPHQGYRGEQADGITRLCLRDQCRDGFQTRVSVYCSPESAAAFRTTSRCCAAPRRSPRWNALGAATCVANSKPAWSCGARQCQRLVLERVRRCDFTVHRAEPCSQAEQRDLKG